MRPKFLKSNDYAPLFFIGAFFMALLAAGTLAIAQQPNQHTKENFCKSIIQLHETLDEKLKDIPRTSKILRGLPAKRFVKAFNEYGEKTNFKADSVGFYVVMHQPDAVLVMFETEHCVTDRFAIPVQLYVVLIRHSENTTSGA